MSRERERFDEIGKKIKRESDALLHPAGGGDGGGGGGGGGRRHIHQLGPPGTLNTITPCAACKLLRRRCAQECPFSPYFSPHEPQKFASVHKIFGASNVSKMLMEVPENQRADTANSIVYEANMRLRDPVYGCMGAISALQQQIQVLQAQLNAVRAEILKYYNYKEANVANINSNINVNDATNYHLPTNFLSSGSGFVSIAAPPPAVLPSPSPPPPALPGLTPSLLDPSDSSISSSMHTQPSSTPDNYSSISNENVSYFG